MYLISYMASSVIYTDLIFEKGAQILAVSVNIFKAKLSPKVDINIIFPSHLLLHYFLKGS